MLDYFQCGVLFNMNIAAGLIDLIKCITVAFYIDLAGCLGKSIGFGDFAAVKI